MDDLCPVSVGIMPAKRSLQDTNYKKYPEYKGTG